jgi:WD40 repeat protein
LEAIFFRIFRQSRHTKLVRALGFDPDGRLFASGSDDGTINLWDGGDGVFRGTLKTPDTLRAVALSNSVLVAGCNDDVTLWSLDTLSPIHTFKISRDYGSKVSIAENSTLIALYLLRPSGGVHHVILFDVVNRTTIRIFDVPSDIHTMTFLPDNSQLVVQSDEGVFQSFNLINNHTTEGPTLEHLVQLPNTPLWHGVPVWHYEDKEQRYLAALFSQHMNPVPVLWIPKQIPVTGWTQGSSMIALDCKDGRIILLQLPTSHVC